MIIIECKNIPRVGETLVVSPNHCTIQDSHDDDGLLDEYIIPIYFNDNAFHVDVYIQLDTFVQSMFINNKFIKIHKTFIESENSMYTFKKVKRLFLKLNSRHSRSSASYPIFVYTAKLLLNTHT